MRAFIAFLPSSSQIKDLQQFQNKIKSYLFGWRFTPAEKLHLTFLFLGNNLDQEQVEQILFRLENISFSTKAFDVQCFGFGAFPSKNHASVLWCGLNNEKLFNLALSIRNDLEKLSFKDDKPFRAHLTIARCSKRQNVSQLLETRSFQNWSENKWLIDNIALIKSIPSSKGYIYNTIKKFQLY